MNVVDEIHSLQSRAKSVSQTRRRQKVILYTEGLKAKIRQTEFALAQLSEYVDKTDDTTTFKDNSDLCITERVYFYCDTFWTFLYSSLDVLAQIVNQALKLGMDEKSVSFKSVDDKVRSTCSGMPIQSKLSSCRNSKAFKNLDAYRNCSTHRRQIYIKEESRVVRHTAGYTSTSTGPVATVERFVCDNPLELKPRTDQKRRIPDYMQDNKDKIVQYIASILKYISPLP